MTNGAPDVIVIGAGLVGAATALALTEAGMQTLILESEFPGGGSTGAAMGHLVVMDDSPAQLALTTYSRARWQQLAETLPAGAEYEARGTLWVASEERDLAGAAARLAALEASGVQAELLTAPQLQRLEPALRRGLAGAIRVPGDGVCYPPAIARLLVERACRAGATLRGGTTVQQLRAGGVVLSSGETISAAHVVLAAGVASTTLLPELPIVPRKGHLAITDRRPGMVHHQLVELGYLHSAHAFDGASVAFNVQPRQNGQLLVGSSRELVGTDPRINRPLVHAMLSRAVEFVPALAELRVLRSWVGFRPATADKLPLIGPWRTMPGVWIAAGHEGLGITMATGTAALITAGIVGTTPPVDPEPFRPDRAMPMLEVAA